MNTRMHTLGFNELNSNYGNAYLYIYKIISLLYNRTLHTHIYKQTIHGCKYALCLRFQIIDNSNLRLLIY